MADQNSDQTSLDLAERLKELLELREQMRQSLIRKDADIAESRTATNIKFQSDVQNILESLLSICRDLQTTVDGHPASTAAAVRDLHNLVQNQQQVYQQLLSSQAQNAPPWLKIIGASMVAALCAFTPALFSAWWNLSDFSKYLPKLVELLPKLIEYLHKLP